MSAADEIPNELLEQRALVAAWRTHADRKPARAECAGWTDEESTKWYVTVRDAAGDVIVVYRVRPRGELRRMAQPPKEVTRPPRSPPT